MATPWNPRSGDILFVGDRRRFGLGTLVRIFSPGDRKFCPRHLRNAFNRRYCTHVCQIARHPNGYPPVKSADNSREFHKDDHFIKDTKARGLIPLPCDFYTRPNNRHQYLLAVISLEEYEKDPNVRRALDTRTAHELAREWPQKRYDYRGILADYVPGFRWVSNDPTIKYCSERVRDDLLTDGCRPPMGTVSPHELYIWARRNGIVVYSEK